MKINIFQKTQFVYLLYTFIIIFILVSCKKTSSITPVPPPPVAPPTDTTKVSPPVIVDNEKIINYFTINTTSGYDPSRVSSTLAYYNLDKTEIWSFTTPLSDVIIGRPLINKDTLYIIISKSTWLLTSTPNYRLLAIDKKNGQVLWINPVQAKEVTHYPIVQDGIVYIPISDESVVSAISRYNSKTGDFISKKNIFSTTRVYDLKYNDNAIYYTLSDYYPGSGASVNRYDIASDKVSWSVNAFLYDRPFTVTNEHVIINDHSSVKVRNKNTGTHTWITTQSCWGRLYNNKIYAVQNSKDSLLIFKLNSSLPDTSLALVNKLKNEKAALYFDIKNHYGFVPILKDDNTKRLRCLDLNNNNSQIWEISLNGYNVLNHVGQTIIRTHWPEINGTKLYYEFINNATGNLVYTIEFNTTSSVIAHFETDAGNIVTPLDNPHVTL